MLEVAGEVSVLEDEDSTRVKVVGEDLGILIGYHGDTLYSFQTLLALSCYKEFGEWKSVLFDVNDYRAERELKLEGIVEDAVSRVRFLQKEIELTPMNSSDRRFIHLLAEKIQGVKSESTGEGYSRRVVLKPEKQITDNR